MTADWLKKDKKPDDMDIVPTNPAANPNDVGSAIPKARRTELIMRLQNEVRPDLFSPQGGESRLLWSLHFALKLFSV
jgi:hypothetical protein